jgi:arylsulfatase A-like enzyme
MKTNLGFVAGLALAGTAFGAQPNILFLCMDDLKPELGCYGSEHVKTPNIDRLAESGMLFTHHYVQQAICAASRVSMFSGLRPDTTKIWDLNHTAREENPAVFTMQEYFKQHGYASIGAGKVMHGFKNDDPQSWTVPFRQDADLPYAKGYGVPADEQYQAANIHDAFQRLEKTGIKGYKPRKDWLSEQGARPATECLDVPDDAYADGGIASYGVHLLEDFAKSREPFFLTLGFHKPHLPFVAPKKYWDLYNNDEIELAAFREHAKDSPDYAYHTWGELRNYCDMPAEGDLTDDQQRRLIHAYYACVSYIDAQVGKVLATLKETGLDKNTIVVLWGDHGWHLGDHGLWCKHSNFEQATHSPLIISAGQGAGSWGNGKRSSSSVESVDIFPTLCELAGLPIPESLQGDSLVPILKNPAAKGKDFSMSQYPRQGDRLMGYALRTGRYRMVTWMKGDIKTTGKFDRSQIVSTELYDYQTDPLEKISQASNPEYKSVVKDLEARLADFFDRK